MILEGKFLEAVGVGEMPQIVDQGGAQKGPSAVKGNREIRTGVRHQPLQKTLGDMKNPQAVVEAGMGRARIHQMGWPELADSLQLAKWSLGK